MFLSPRFKEKLNRKEKQLGDLLNPKNGSGAEVPGTHTHTQTLPNYEL